MLHHGVAFHPHLPSSADFRHSHRKLFLFLEPKSSLKGVVSKSSRRSRKARSENYPLSQKTRFRKHANTSKNVGNGELPVTRLLRRRQCSKCCKMSNKVFTGNVRSFLSAPHISWSCLICISVQIPRVI